MTKNVSHIVFGGGCFWCIESCFNMLRGVESAVSGYAGGNKENPTYEEVCTGKTGHAEVVELIYIPSIISYEQLMEVFFFLHDPTQLNRQGNDVGSQYRSVVFYSDENEKIKAYKALEESKKTNRWKGEYVTEIAPLKRFYPAEKYHQGYYNRNSVQPYCSGVVEPKIRRFEAHYGAKGWLK
ncbi:MAG: peptide-methionine (S)-S-oxide reductase MsrA [Bergeyella sp.]|nr:peptide-methionine (S)-S-oxide reductase MsrA [Bergeyella sp.]